jgi:hypothetical protein
VSGRAPAGNERKPVAGRTDFDPSVERLNENLPILLQPAPTGHPPSVLFATFPPYLRFQRATVRSSSGDVWPTDGRRDVAGLKLIGILLDHEILTAIVTFNYGFA